MDKFTLICARCKKQFPAEQMLHCGGCGNCYCEKCAKQLAICECCNELTYFD